MSNMDEKKYLEESSKNAELTLHQAKKIAMEYLEEIKASDASDLYSYNRLVSFIDDLVMQEEICGDANDFHNFAVDLARENQEHLACRLLNRGLKQFPHNVDLLADYLQYGISTGKDKECEKVYETLMKIPHNRWTWRGFSFLMNYLQHIMDDISFSRDEINELKEKIEFISDEYIHFFPYNEEGYRAKGRMFSSIKDDPDAELRILEKGMDIVRVCPKSALKCADIYFERGEYEKALVCVERAIKDANQTQGSINEGYVYYLGGLCKIALLNTKDESEKLDCIDEIYADFNSAFLEFGYDVDNTYKTVMIKKTKIIRSRYEREIPSKYSKLLENMDE